jgi:hypothetical protein
MVQISGTLLSLMLTSAMLLGFVVGAWVFWNSSTTYRTLWQKALATLEDQQILTQRALDMLAALQRR